MGGGKDKNEASGPGPSTGGPARLVETIIDRYRVTDVIASGGMSTLYRAQHVHMRKHVAIKVLDAKAEKLPELVARFQREAIVGAHLAHPNIAHATDFGQLADGSYFLVLEYVPGTTLTKLIAQGPMPTARAVAIARQVASALQAAHEAGVVHRDVKPGNIMVIQGEPDVVKLVDFGFAKVRLSQVPSVTAALDQGGAPDGLTAAGVVLGTVAYMAPEAALGMPAVDERSDLYALGLILYELLAGRHPFDAVLPTELFLQQRTARPPPISTRTPGVAVPPALEAVVMKLLEKDPEDRYRTARELVSVLDTAMLSMNIASVPEISASAVEVDALVAKSEPRPAAPLPPPVGPPRRARSGPAAPSPAPPAPSAAKVRLDRLKQRVSHFVGEARERTVRRASALFRSLPRDGRLPRWAYVGLPLIGLAAFIAVLTLAARKAPKVDEEGVPDALRSEGPAASLSAASPPTSALAEPAPKPVEPPPAASTLAPPPPPEEPANTASEPRAAAIESSGLDAAGWRTSLRNAARQKDWAKAGEAVLGLLRLDPRSLRSYDVANAARATAVALNQAGGEPSDRFFSALSKDVGSGGLDLLYDVSRFRPGTKAAKTSLDILRRPDVLAKLPAPLRILVDFQNASCGAKKDLFPKMSEQGDDRALFELELLRDTECPRRTDPCCFKENKALVNAIRILRSRAASGGSPPASP